MSWVRALLLLVTALATLPGHAVERPGFDFVSIPTVEGPPLRGVLYRPAGAGPFPAIVALHGCGGLFTGQGRIGARQRDWGERLAAQGFVVLLPDSFGSRALGSQCVVSDRKVRPSRERVDDAIAARVYLQGRTDVDPAAVSLLGWSNGGSTVLWAAGAKARPLDGLPDFNRAIAFYPGCRPVLEATDRNTWEARLPVLILMGEADTWTPIGPCRALVGRSMTTGKPLEIVAYAGAVHDFDHPDRSPTARTGLAFTGDNSGTAMVATDPIARADALTRVPDFLRR
jgi:dienelactone hydrolase